jgi:type IV fimbrial biogenesis protein FimT
MSWPAVSSTTVAIIRDLRCPERGLTLTEMLVAMALAAILMSQAAPSVAEFMASLQLSSASNNLMASLYLARNEAIKRNGRVVLCKTTDGIHCAASGGWEQGWIVFHDVNNNSLREETEQIIQHQIALSGSLRMTGNMPLARYISYGSTGGTQLVGGAFQAGTLTLCQASASAGDARQIILNAAGRPRVQKAAIPRCD